MDIAQPNVKELLELLTKEVYEVPQEKSYWLIRTQGGILYDAFKQECVVSIEHSVPLRIIQVFAQEYGSNKKVFTDAIKEYMMEGKDKSLFSSAELHGFGLKASQIYNFYFELKKGDIIIIPAENSDEFTFGQIINTHLNAYNVDDAMRVGIASGMFKDFKYIKTIKKYRLDPLLFKAFSSHQAISKLTMDPSVVERSIRDMFVSNDFAHFIIDIETEDIIPANDIFGLGNDLLKFIDGFSRKHGLDFDSTAFGLNINLNSPGK
jgi:predicted Mrr-cat superfamily restriction endonuclease